MRPATPVPPYLRLPRRALAWLLLVLLLPLAQAVATGHAVSHLAGEDGGASPEKQALHAAHCALCATAATVTGAAPLPAAFTLALAEATQPAPALPGLLPWIAAPARPYDSRAPPALTH